MSLDDLARSVRDGRTAIAEIRAVIAALSGVVSPDLLTQLGDAADELDRYLLSDAESALAHMQQIAESALAYIEGIEEQRLERLQQGDEE